MRTYKLVNNDGTEYELTETHAGFLYNVSGLGFERDTEYRQVSSRFALSKDNLSQQSITGTVRFFHPGAERKYFDFVRFLNNTPLTLKYNPGIGEFIRHGSVVSCEKSDSGEGALRAFITFRCTTPWIKRVFVMNDGSLQAGKVYNYRYNYTYSDDIAQTIHIHSDSFLKCPVRLIIHGPAVNPSWRHYVNNKLVATGRINFEIERDRRLRVDNIGLPYRIEQIDGMDALVSDLYQMSDFSTKRFLEIEHGTNTISVANESAEILTFSVETEIEYASV